MEPRTNVEKAERCGAARREAKQGREQGEGRGGGNKRTVWRRQESQGKGGRNIQVFFSVNSDNNKYRGVKRRGFNHVMITFLFFPIHDDTIKRTNK